ncbi:MAG: hypothetical protein B1H08_05990 [Candidatus Omnitrophica bacterium 4484_171]|nr:MAG: hypothetical protein B1H08_05990 [Candidatus Omnitrophica bacterium 4484_171]
MHRILVVDDEREIVDILAKFLEKSGFDVVTAYGGKDGIDIILSDERIDLAVLDMKMPQVSGADVLEAMYNAGKVIPVVILSGSLGVQKNIEVVRKLGYNENDILVKPINLGDLLEAVKKKLP